MCINKKQLCDRDSQRTYSLCRVYIGHWQIYIYEPFKLVGRFAVHSRIYRKMISDNDSLGAVRQK